MTRKKRVRRARPMSEAPVTKSTITSPDLDDGGKLQPAQGLPGGSGIMPEENERPKTIRPMRHAIKALPVEKIKDVDSYDPRELTDEVLRDDFRIVLAWYAAWRKDPANFRHDRPVLIRLLHDILKELTRRGPEVVRFNPTDMAPAVRDFFLAVARDVGVPREMFKRLTLSPDWPVDAQTTEDLLGAHFVLHMKYRDENRGIDVEGWSVEDVVNLHALVVEELFKRGVKHPPPPDDGLDDQSSTFEPHASKQPDWTRKPSAVLKRVYAPVLPSGDVDGDTIFLREVLDHLKSFRMRRPWIWLVGGLAEHGQTTGDIDILIRDADDLPDHFKRVLEFRIARMMPPELRPRINIHYDRFHGPFTNHVELFDLIAERVNPDNEVKVMSIADALDDGEPVFMSEREKAYADCVEVLWQDDEEEDTTKYLPLPIAKDAGYWCAFLFDGCGVDEAHVTHKYLGDLDKDQVKAVADVLAAYFKANAVKPINVEFNVPRMFGPDGDTRVLVPEVERSDEFLPDLKDQLDRIKADEWPMYRPHVTTEAATVTTPIVGYAFMIGTKPLATFGFKEDTE